jgi:hypothetical protein
MCSAALGTFFAINGKAWRIRTAYFAMLGVCILIEAYYTYSLRSVVDLSITSIRGAEAKGLWLASGVAIAGGMLLALTFPFLFAQGIRLWIRTAAALTVALALLGVALSFSRTFYAMVPIAMLVTVIVGARAGLILVRARFLINIGMLLLAFLFLAFVAVVALPRIAGHLPQLEKAVSLRFKFHDRSGTQRASEAKAIVGWLVQRPTTLVTGWGLGNKYKMWSVDAAAVGGIGTIERDFSHDWWLYLLLTTGLTGLTAMLACVVSLWRTLISTLGAGRRQGAGAFATLNLGLLATLCVIIGTSFTFQPFGVLLWNVMFGMLCAVVCGVASYSSEYESQRMR